MLRLFARHRTEMVYAGDARDSINEVRLCPVTGGRQRVESATVVTEPAADIHHHTDAFGNRVAWFQVVEPHGALVVEARACVTIASHVPRPGPVAWDALDHAGLRDRMAEFLQASSLVHWDGPVEDFARELAIDAEGDVAQWLRHLEAAVNGHIRYRPGSTTVDTTVERVIEDRQGVCQDMAHLFLALCRRRGVPSRYVSGWLHEPGRDHPGESHAWCDVWIPGAGWVEFDPTHPAPNLDHYIRLAVGRDYSDVPPLRGTYNGAPTERMVVTVEIDEIAEPSPLGLATEAG